MEHSKRRKSHVENRTYKTKQGKKKNAKKNNNTEGIKNKKRKETTNRDALHT